MFACAAIHSPPGQFAEYITIIHSAMGLSVLEIFVVTMRNTSLQISSEENKIILDYICFSKSG